MYSLLYVDDEQGLLDLGQLFLESDGEFRVTTAISGKEGLRFLAGQEFDAVVSDYQMPEMNGIELLKKVRKSYGNIPFILFTGRGREEVVIEAINNGVDFYLQKGGDPKAQFAELAHKVRQAVTRRRAEAALSESEKRLSDIINFLPDATFAIDTAGVVIAWNRAMERMTGVRSEDVLGKGDYEYALPFYHERRPLLIDLVLNDSPEIAKKYPFVKREGKTLISEITIPHFNDGRGAALWFTASPLYDRKGTVAGAIESIREITERKRAETALNESERRFRELADLLPQGIYEADNDGLITYANRLALEMFGYTAEDIQTGVYALNVIAPVDRERAAAVFSRLTGTGNRGGEGLEYLAVRKDGALFPVSIFSSPVYRDGRIAGLRGVIEDITERKKAEERLISANREYTSLLDQIQDIYYFSNMEGRLVRASRSLATLLGYDDIAECIGRSIADDFYLNPADRKPLLDEIRRNGRVTGYEIRLRKKDGTPVFVDVSSHLTYDHEGKVTGVEGTFHDITARKKAEEELRAAYEQLTANEEELKEQYNELAASGQRIRESEQKYRTVFETTGTAMLMIEDDTTISLVNSEFCRLSGYPREEIENKKKWTEFVVPEDREQMLARHRGRRTDTAVALKQYEFRFVSRSGEIRHILLSIDIIPGTKKSVASLLDITERKKAADELQAANEQLAATGEELRAQYEELALSEKRVRLSEARLKYMLGFYEFAQKSEKELIAYAIEGAGIVTGSPLGYLAFLNDDETELSMYAWSKNAMAECSMVTKPIVYQVEKTGLWGEAVRQRRPVITNDYAAPNPAKKGYPEGHPHIVRHMNVPVIDNDHIVLVAGVANKESGYTETDVNELLLLVQGLWENLKRRRAEEIKRESEAKFRNVIENAPVGMHFYSLEADGALMFRGANPGADRILGVDHTRFIGKTIETAFPSLVTTEIPAHYRRIAAEGGTWQTDQITYDGQQIRGAFAVTAFQTRPGEMIATFVDITARKKTEMELREAYEQLTASEEELREQYDSLAAAEAEISARRRQLEEIASNVPGVVYQFFARPDGSRGLYYAGSHAREIFGLEPDLDTFFSAFTDGVHPDDRERFLASIDEAVGQRADWHFEGRFIRASGEIIWFEGRSTPVSRGDELVFSGVLSDITGRKKMEAAILESEERYRSLVELSPVAVVVHSRDKILFANPEALRLVGATTQEEVVGRDILPFIHPDDRAMAMEDFRLLYEEGRTVPLKEERLLRLNGEPFNVEVTASPIQFQGGSAVLVVFRDITRRRQAEAALAESERKYRTVFETAEEGIWIVDAGFMTVSANRKMQELFGYTEEEMRGRPVWDFVPSDEAESVKRELSRRPQGIPGRYEREWVRKDGSIIWCLTSATPLFSPSGEFLGSFGMFTDITERRRAEDALRASEKKYRLLVENIPFGITLIDADHRIVMSNTAQGQMFQTDEGLWPGRYCYREFEKRDTVCAHCPGTKAMATGVCEVVETEGVRDDGTRFHARIHAIPLPDDEGKATRFIEVVEDITERKKAEDALRQDEEKYRTLIETTGTGYVIIDQDGHVLDANPEYVRLTGHSRLEEITGRNVIEWTAEHEKERNAEAVRQCLRDGFIRNFEIDYAGRDGTIIPIEINATVLRSEGSVHILTLCRDISDRQRIQDALKTSAEDYQTLLQTAMDGFCIIGMDGAIIDVNEAFCRSLGYSRDEALALSLRDVEARETDEDTSRHMGTILRKGYDRFETQWRRKDGRIVDTEVSVLYTGTHGGRFITFSRDITERRNAEHALRESEARFRAVIDQSFQLTGLMTPDGTLIHVNRAALALIGASEPDVVNRPFWETPWWAHSEELREKLKDAIRRAASGETVRFEATHPAADGHLAYIDFSVKPVVDPDGRIRYLIPEGRDITEIKQTERALQASEEQHRILAGLLDLIPASVTVHDAEGRFLYANQKTFEYHGYTKDEFYRINLHDLDVPESERLINDRIRELRERGSASFETQHFRKDRSQIPLLINAMMTTWGGEPVILSIATDITEHRNIRNALQQSEEKYRTLVESSFDGIAIHQDGAVVYVNRTGAMLLGSEDPEVFIGKPAISIIAPAFRDKIAKRIQESAEKPLGLIREQFLKLDGTPIDVDVTTTPTTWKGRPASYVTFRDITEQIRVEAALEKRLIALTQPLDSTDIAFEDLFNIGEIQQLQDKFAKATGVAVLLTRPDGTPITQPSNFCRLCSEIVRGTERGREKCRISDSVLGEFHEGGPFVHTCLSAGLWGAGTSIVLGGRHIANWLIGQVRNETQTEEGMRKYARELGVDEEEFIRAFLEVPVMSPEQFGAVAQSLSILSDQLSRYAYQNVQQARFITERRRAEEALRESEEKYRTLVEVNRDIIYSLGTDGTILYISPQTETQLGYRPDEMIGQNFAKYIHPDDLGTLLNHIREHAGTGTDIQADRFRVRRNDGAYRWYEDKSIYTSDHHGSRIVAGTIRDITDEKAAQDALRESEEKFRTLVETTSDFIWEVDTTGKYTYVSPQVSRILGYEPGELIGKTPFELMPPDEAERISAEFNLLVRSGLPIAGLVNRALRKDGSVVILETSGTVRTSDDGRFQGYRGIDRDITERTKTEEALREKTEELNRFFSASLDLFCIADTDGHFRRLNPEWEKTLGYTLGELEGHRFLDFVHPDDLPTTLSAVADLRGQKNVLNFTNRYRHKDGTYRWIEWRSLPMGGLIFAAARDITARHDAAERTARISALKQDLLRTAPPEEKLKRITDAFVDIFGADFARIWISGPGDLCSRGCIHADVTEGPHICRDRTKCLHLIVSSGRYTHTDGDHRRVPFGAYKIGRIATGQESQFITNDVTRDPRVHNHAWAASLGLVSFAGFRLVSADGKPIGVLAFFSRLPVLPEIMDDLADMATTASQVIQTGMAEQALRESESRLSSILHGSPVLQFVIDRGHRVISWNRALEEYSGIRADDIIGTDMQWRAFYAEKRPVLADLLVDQDIEKIDTWYAGKFAKSRYVEGAYTATDFFPHMGTSGKWLSFTAAPVRDEKGTIIGAVETLEDITDRINAENALRQSEEWARTILNTAQTGIVIVDAATHRILEANTKALDLIGLPAESVTGSICHRFICPADEGKCPVSDCGMTVDTSERILIAANGAHVPVLKTVIPVTMGDHTILVESFVDISEHKRSEFAIREANRKLNLLSSITRHDVANQLTVVHGYTQLAAMKEPDPVVKDFLAKIEAAVETIQRQIEFTKQYQELGVHAPAWFNLGDVIRKARPGNVRLRCSCDPFEVFADPMIGRVFYNLFDNAMKYGEHVTLITAGCKQQGDELLVTFADNGVGIPLDEKRKIFEKGYGKNTGFGLFLAREILAITGITIHEAGKEGKGARFEIVVPKGAFRKRS